MDEAVGRGREPHGRVPAVVHGAVCGQVAVRVHKAEQRLGRVKAEVAAQLDHERRLLLLVVLEPGPGQDGMWGDACARQDEGGNM